MEKLMFRTLILAGASVMALSLAGSGLALANDMQNDRNNHQIPSGAKAEHSQSSGQSSQQGSQPSQPGSPAPQQASRNATKGGTDASRDRDELMQAQQKLKSEGLYRGKVDGVAGPETQQALKQFQQKNQLQQSGQLDEQTEAKLGINEAMQGSGSSQPPSGMNGKGMKSPTTQNK
jgi:peptidoglycan hydrolase-like protein with peptidoglycan-binding domain